MNIDQHLIRKCLEDDRVAQKQLYQQCYTLLMGIGMRYMKDKDDAADALNQSFMKIIQGLETYEHQKNFKAWSQRIMVNTCIDILRKRKRYLEREYPFDPRESLYKNTTVDWNKAESKLGAEAILVMVRALPEKTRQVFNLYVMEGFQHKEIGEMLEISEGTSKWHLSKARKLLQNKIAAQLKIEKQFNVNAS